MPGPFAEMKCDGADAPSVLAPFAVADVLAPGAPAAGAEEDEEIVPDPGFPATAVDPGLDSAFDPAGVADGTPAAWELAVFLALRGSATAASVRAMSATRP